MKNNKKKPLKKQVNNFLLFRNNISLRSEKEREIFILSSGVMVALQILDLPVRVRILPGQQKNKMSPCHERRGFFLWHWTRSGEGEVMCGRYSRLGQVSHDIRVFVRYAP